MTFMEFFLPVLRKTTRQDGLSQKNQKAQKYFAALRSLFWIDSQFHSEGKTWWPFGL